MRSSSGEILEEKRIKTERLEKYFKNVDSPSKVVMETCAQSVKVAGWALECGHKTVVIPGTLVRTLGVGSRGVKNDRKDAQVLSEVSTRINLPGVHLKAAQSRERQKWISMRLGLVSSRTQLINQVRGYLREEMVSIRGGLAKTLPTRVRRKLGEVPMVLAGHLKMIEELSTQIQVFEDRINEEIQRDPVLARLMTVPGVGPITAMAFASSVDQADRFADAHRVASFYGLTPGERSSGLKRRSTSITKAGPSTVRWLLIQGAHCVLRTRPHDPMSQWAQGIAERRGKRIAIVALARKMAGILWAMLRNQSTYQPSRAAMTQK